MDRKLKSSIIYVPIVVFLLVTINCISPVMVQLVANTSNPLPPTITAVSITDSSIPPTNTAVPPTDTPRPPTHTPIPATSTNTPLPPTATVALGYVISRIVPKDGYLSGQLAEQARKAGELGLTPVVYFDAPW